MTDIFMTSVTDIGGSIQFAIAPIFLLVGTGSVLNVVTTRLGRVIDRARILETLIEQGEEATLEARHRQDLIALDKRMRHCNRAVLFCTLAIVLICVLVGFVFVADLLNIPAGAFVALLFLSVVSSLIIGLVSFLMEVSIATSVLRVRNEILVRGQERDQA